MAADHGPRYRAAPHAPRWPEPRAALAWILQAWAFQKWTRGKIEAETHCWRCNAALAAAEDTCPRCGADQVPF